MEGKSPTFAEHEQGSLNRLKSLSWKLKRDGIINAYDAIIKEQKEEGVVEAANAPAKG